MTVRLNHTIVHARDKRAAAEFYSSLFGLGKPVRFGPFLVSEAEFDRIFGRVKARGLAYWADPGKSKKGKINTHDGGRGVYFEDPGGHLLEIITRPYGSGQ